MRESPAEKLIDLLRNAGAEVSYHDPHVPEFDGLEPRVAARARAPTTASRSSPRIPSIDYADVVRRARLVVDFRNATRGVEVDGQGLEAVSRSRRASAGGLGYWGPNLARNFDELADLAWLCDLDPELRDAVRATATRRRAATAELRRAARRRRRSTRS